jgi:hypothetical protein
MTTTIEQIWAGLRAAGSEPLHRRIDATHPLELYAVVEPPNRPGLVLFCPTQPPRPRVMRSLAIERGVRPDGRAWLRILLDEPSLAPVFATLCNDVVAFTRSGVSADGAAIAVLSRIERWRALLDGGRASLDRNALRGLIAELVVLENEVMTVLPAFDAVAAWTGPDGSPQDFTLPGGLRLEVKAIGPSAATVAIHGLDQLDPGPDRLTLIVVRLLDVPAESDDAVTAPDLVGRHEARLDGEPAALAELQRRLAAAGWTEHPDHAAFAVRIVGLERYAVDDRFPRLTRAMVPPGIEAVQYAVRLPPAAGGPARREALR